MTMPTYKDIMLPFKTWTQAERTAFCNKLTESNNIEEICQGRLQPLSCEEFHPSIKKDFIY